MIPKDYAQAEWRNTTPKDEKTQRIGIGFDLSTGEIIRLSISLESAKHLKETLHEFLSTDQSPNSSDISNKDVSTPLDGENV